MIVYLLWDYGDLIGVYADADTAEADRQVLLVQARADLPGRSDDDYQARVHVDEVTPRTAPRFSA